MTKTVHFQLIQIWNVMYIQRAKALLLVLIDFTKEIEMHETTNLYIIVIISVKYFIKNL